MLRGSVEEFRLESVFKLIGGAKKSGVLFVLGQDEEVRIFFSKGDICRVDGNGSEPLEPGSMRATDHIDLASGRRYSGNEGASVTLDAIERSALDLLTWTEGEFHFEGGTDIEHPAICIPVVELLSEFHKRTVELERLRREVPLWARPSLEPTAPAGVEIVLRFDEWQVISSVDGRRSVADIIAGAPGNDYETLRLLSRLEQRGVLRLVPSPSTQASGRPRIAETAARVPPPPPPPASPAGR